MNFSIEVPGETNPFNLQDLCRVLEAATSNNHTQRQSATQQLGQWETTAEYFPALQVGSLFVSWSAYCAEEILGGAFWSET